MYRHLKFLNIFFNKNKLEKVIQNFSQINFTTIKEHENIRGQLFIFNCLIFKYSHNLSKLINYVNIQ